MKIKILKSVLEQNDNQAQINRKKFKQTGTLGVNVMGSPGCGKTTLIEEIVKSMKDKYRIGVIEGDYAGTVDAEKLSSYGIPVVQLDVSSCHLNADFVGSALNHMSLDELDIVLIENVGNLICPAEFDIGDLLKLVLYSVPEGDDKPIKYPLMFSQADAVVLTKIDLLPHFEFNKKKVKESISRLNKKFELFEFSKKDPTSVKLVANYLESNFRKLVRSYGDL